ncbi:SNARE associated Golgi protein [Tolumonas auensis DSM 9187]|uniref:SNARE associated Golgi protein n=1 Tax=Tolumonas auensis (strain DSM 9187 / NBRC 110442 / TA 4) TaxID=595494 RepID=C4LFR1_TOLAT|nr:YqaA family protein [Tolumonas auensis]ACQ93428.1 SNARE associated Golgi protein [Tolumonas auensis DSM 9187]
MIELSVYAGLFFVALLSASILPLQSEAVLVGLLLSETHPVWLLLAVASTGNVLGSLVNWYLGKYLQHFQHRRWFPVKPDQLDKASRWYQKYGKWSLLLSWVPIIGDPLTVIAGVLREPFVPFLLLVTVAKVSRYLVLAGITLY